MRVLKALSLGVFLLFSCNQHPEPGRIYRGMLVLGNEVSDFWDCDDPSRTFWVVDETANLEEAYQRVARREYESIYVEVEAVREAAPDLGYAGERDGQIRIKKVIRIEPLNDTNRCIPATGQLFTDTTGIATPSSLFPEFPDSDIAAMYERYLDLKGALVASEPDLAAKSARVLNAASVKFGAVQQLCQQLAGQKDLQEQRAIFATLNEVFIPLLREQAPREGTVFVFSTGEPTPRHWLANEARISNPYNGSKKIGTLVETVGR